MRQGVFLIPLLYVLPMYWGLDGLWYSFPLSDLAAFLLTLVFLRLKANKDLEKNG
jgi:Na+-driven multidrug efflux pump